MRDAVRHACGSRGDISSLSEAAWTIFSELIGNVQMHSGTTLDGFAALQVYTRGNKLSATVADSGIGILRKLRPALAREAPDLVGASDVEVLCEALRRGISSTGIPGHGLGLPGCAAKALKFKASLDIRTGSQRVLLRPSDGTYSPTSAYPSDGLPHLDGTHMTFTFRLVT